MNYRTDREFALEQDAVDPLASYRNKFHFPKNKNGKEVIYFCGNSLGLQPKNVKTYVNQELKDWESFAVEGHFHAKNPWLTYHEPFATSFARLVGAREHEVVCMNTLTVNLHLMMVSFYRPSPERHKILIEYNAFPSDRYAVQSQIKFHNFDPGKSIFELKPHSGSEIVDMKDVELLIQEHGASIALILVGGVNYYSGQKYDMQKITQWGHEHDCLVGFDLAHAIGNVELELHEWDVDFAVWCTYKYLNAGPGSIAGCFVHEKHARLNDIPRFAGWWGHNKERRFQMGPAFNPIPGVEGWQLSNPPILSMAPLKASLEIFDELSTKSLKEKSIKLTGYLEYLIDQLNSKQIRIITPRNPDERGSQISLQTKVSGKQIFNELVKDGVVCDWREPDVIRVAPVPLYNCFLDVFRFVQILKNSLLKSTGLN
jgi:kynureninase